MRPTQSGDVARSSTHSVRDKFFQRSGERLRRKLAMKGHSTVLGKRFRQSEGVQLNVRIPMSEPFEYRCHDVTGTKKHWVRYVRKESWGVRYPISPSSWTLSHKLRISSQFSPVRFSSVVLAGAEREEAFHALKDIGSYRQSRRTGSLSQL